MSQNKINELYSKEYIEPVLAAKLLGVTRQNVWYLIREGRLVADIINGGVYVQTQSLLNYANQLRMDLLDRLVKIKVPDKL